MRELSPARVPQRGDYLVLPYWDDYLQERMLYTFTCPPANPCPACRHHLGLTKITQGWPDPVLRQADFLPKGVIFLRVHDTAEWLCTEIKLNHAKEWNPSPVQQPGWSWATWYDSFRGMVFPGRQPVWADAGTKVNPLEPINKVLEICSLISNTLLTTLLL